LKQILIQNILFYLKFDFLSFRQNEGVIVLGATNRRKDLDKALMRPGRFDVEIYVNKPDYFGRKEILDLYLSRILTHEVDTVYLARCTTGFTGADLENMVRKIRLFYVTSAISFCFLFTIL